MKPAVLSRGADARAPASLRQPPHSVDAEQAVLGGLMLSPEAFDRVADHLNEADFYRRDHRAIWRAIADLANKGMPCDAVTLGDWFDANGLADLMGGSTYVIELANATPSAANIVAYANIVREKSILRQLINAGTGIAEDGYEPGNRQAQEVLEAAEQRVFQIAEAGARGRAGPVSIDDGLRAFAAALAERELHPGSVTGLPTGFRELDEMTAGLQPADLVIVAARPAMGKTAFAINIAEHAATRSKKAVAIFSLEMSCQQITARLVSGIAGVGGQALRAGELDDTEWPRVSDAMATLHGLPIFIDDTAALSPAELRSRARRLHREHGGLGLIVVDYLQLMAVPGSRENRATELSEISRGLKALAKELHVPVVALSQLNRAVEQRPDRHPMMSDLRESGAIEQDADVIMFIYRDEYYNAESADKGLAEIIIGKQRNGPTGVCKLAFRSEFTRFEDPPGQ